MRLARKNLLALLLLAPLAACGDHHTGGEAPMHEHGASAPTEGDAVPDLQLDDGERWRMDDHTRKMFAVMSRRFEGFEGGQAPAADLGIALSADIDELIRGCTMTGAAHGKLHEYLAALMPAVDGLADGGGEEQLRAVEEILASYPRFFE